MSLTLLNLTYKYIYKLQYIILTKVNLKLHIYVHLSNLLSLRANPLTRSPEQVKLDSDKLKL
jgi:hypothetical protein